MNNVTTAQIEALEVEAGEAGDSAQVELCQAALAGDQNAFAKCAKAIENAAAMCDEE